MKKSNAWNIRRLVAELFVSSTQRITLKIVGYKVVFLLCFQLKYLQCRA